MLTSMIAPNMIRILQGSVVTQTMLGGLTIPKLQISFRHRQKLWKLWQ